MSIPASSPAFADEVVTRALVRYLEVPGMAGEFALITLDNGHDHTRPSTLRPGRPAVTGRGAGSRSPARSPRVSAVGVTGKPFIFAVGADISGIGLVTDRGQALAIAAEGHRVFARLRDLDVPTFAFVNGAALGGGPGAGAALRLPDACRVRLRRSPFPNASWDWCRAGAAPSCCPT